MARFTLQAPEPSLSPRICILKAWLFKIPVLRRWRGEDPSSSLASQPSLIGELQDREILPQRRWKAAEGHPRLPFDLQMHAPMHTHTQKHTCIYTYGKKKINVSQKVKVSVKPLGFLILKPTLFPSTLARDFYSTRQDSVFFCSWNLGECQTYTWWSMDVFQ